MEQFRGLSWSRDSRARDASVVHGGVLRLWWFLLQGLGDVRVMMNRDERWTSHIPCHAWRDFFTPATQVGENTELLSVYVASRANSSPNFPFLYENLIAGSGNEHASSSQDVLIGATNGLLAPTL